MIQGHGPKRRGSRVKAVTPTILISIDRVWRWLIRNKGRSVLISPTQKTTEISLRHPGEEIVYVLEGSSEYQLEGQPAAVLKAGDVFFLPAGIAHIVKNVGRDNGGELATYVVEKGKPLVELVE